jgi:bifunctional non-homologous end joining protein LigD
MSQSNWLPSRDSELGRRGLDWTERYPALVTAGAQLAAKSAILDGEMVVQNELGISDFHALLPDPRASRGTLA